MADKLPLDWIFYQHKYEYALGKGKYDDPQYVALMPSMDKFNEYILSCSTAEFTKTIVEIFRDHYPVNFLSIDSMLSWDEKTETCIEGKAFRKAGDIKQIYFETDEDGLVLEKVLFKYTNKQTDANKWVETGLEGKAYSKTVQGGFTTYKLVNEVIEKVEVNEMEFRLYVNSNKAPE
ncbi:MAG: hypothetical protein NTW29_14250 [Bacteroidetes bacterium]|nr:hypothetical protein [Bacteroidota bacterium]